jgi:hypothetical protein
MIICPFDENNNEYKETNNMRPNIDRFIMKIYDGL